MISFALMVMSVLWMKFFTEFDKNDASFCMLHIKCLLKTHYQLFELTTSMLGSNEGEKKGFLCSVSKINLRISLVCYSGWIICKIVLGEISENSALPLYVCGKGWPPFFTDSY